MASHMSADEVESVRLALGLVRSAHRRPWGVREEARSASSDLSEAERLLQRVLDGAPDQQPLHLGRVVRRA